MRSGRGSGRPGPRPSAVRPALALLLLACGLPVAAHGQSPAPIESQALFDTSDWVVLGSLMAAHLALFPLDDDVRDVVVDMRGSASNRAADMLRPLGRTPELAAAGAATYLVGLAISNRRVADFGLHAFVTLALSNALTGGLKAVTGRARPLTHQADGSWARNEANHWDFFGGWGTAYPSGHTSNAFALATVFAEELGGAAGWVAYPIAAGVAWSRLNDEAHWASDVVLGAAVGIVTGQLVVRHGHRSGGWLERSLLVEPSSSLAAVDIGLRIPSR